MQSIRGPLEKLVVALQRFVADSDLRLLQVVTEGALRTTVLEHVAAAEHLSLNQCPFVILEAPSEADDDGFDIRADELRTDLEAGMPEALEATPPSDPSHEGLSGFGLLLASTLSSMPETLDGLVVVLAPLWVRDEARWNAGVRSLLERPELARARFIVVDPDEPVSRTIREQLGARALDVEVRIDRDVARRELAEQLAALRASPVGNEGPRAVGAAGPAVPPPARQGRPSASDASALRDENEPAASALSNPELARDLRILLLSVVASLSDGAPVQAVRDLRRTIELCRSSGLLREAITLELMLGSAVLQQGRVESALDVLGEARKHAHEMDASDLEVQCLLSLGVARMQAGRADEAASTLERAGKLGAESGQTVLAIEAYRACGQVLITQERYELAIRAWNKALALTDSAPPAEVSASSAPEMAQALAMLCREHGLTSHAADLEARAEALAAPSEPDELEGHTDTRTSTDEHERARTEGRTDPVAAAGSNPPLPDSSPEATAVLPLETTLVLPEIPPSHSIEETLMLVVDDLFAAADDTVVEATRIWTPDQEKTFLDLLNVGSPSTGSAPSHESGEPYLWATMALGRDAVGSPPARTAPDAAESSASSLVGKTFTRKRRIVFAPVPSPSKSSGRDGEE